jgi:hypothetical protein
MGVKKPPRPRRSAQPLDCIPDMEQTVMRTMLKQPILVSFAALAIGLLAFAPMVALATTWARTEVFDPFTKDRVQAAEPRSSGSYIYHWPEKVDQVFWPYTDDHWLWFGPKSGYIAFGGDFEKLEPDEVERLKPWLAANYDRKAPPESRLERLFWAEKVYGVRGMDHDFWCHFYRLMAFETRESPETSAAYVRKALPLLQKRLESSDDLGPKLEALYLLNEYNHRLGNDAEARTFLERLTAFEVDEELAGYKSYLLKIAEEQRTRPPTSQEH